MHCRPGAVGHGLAPAMEPGVGTALLGNVLLAIEAKQMSEALYAEV